MKKIFTIAAIAAATVLSASCAKEIEGEFQKEGIIAHASLQPVEATKAIGEYSYNIVWEENDKIAVLDNASNKASFKLTDGARTTSGTFQQEGTDALTAPLTAYYPASVVAEDKSLVWPATQADVKNISNVPMTASSPTATGEVNFAFKHLGSVLQLVLTAKNGEINVKQIDITADQGLSGAFTVENGAAVISNTGTTITTGDISAKNIKLSATASYLNFAVPAGEFTSFKITITDIHDKTYSLSAANLTLNRAMVNKVTFAIDAKDPAVFVLNVNGHTVRIVHSSDEGIPDDVWIKKAEVVDNSVVVTAQSVSGKHLKCTMSDGDFCTSHSKTDNVFTFTISDISDDDTATIGYAKAVSITTSVYPEGSGAIRIKGELYEGETVALVPNAGYEYGIDCWKDKNGGILSDSYDFTIYLSQDEQITACFKKNLILGGEFTVGGVGNKVRFTRGNLYKGSSIEQRQYDFDSSPRTADAPLSDHISHFMWCSMQYSATDIQYNTRWNGSKPFFANDGTYRVKGFDYGECFVLSNSEWDHLLEERKASTINGIQNARYFKGCIQKDDGSSINGLFILPDEFTWPAFVRALPSGINEGSAGYDTNTYTHNDFKRLQDAGIVFLPAAGFRRGSAERPEMVLFPGDYGCYWSSSYSDFNEKAWLFWFTSSMTKLVEDLRSYACAVRLVTKVTAGAE